MKAIRPLLGSHLSISGGYHRAAEAASAYGMGTVQIFTKNNNQWKGKPLTDEECRQFRAALKAGDLHLPCAHNSYLINIASPSSELWDKSIDAMTVEVERAEALGLVGLVMHPGSHLDSGEEVGLQKVVEGLDEVHRRTRGATVKILVEATAGQGSNLGHRFEHLGTILKGVQDSDRLGICLDTCHIFAAGYPLKARGEYDATFQEFDDRVGIDRIRAFHLNDSKKGLGSRVDRHEHIGEGEIGLEPFRWLLNDPRFGGLPMFLETKKEQRDGEEMDAVNLRLLTSLFEAPAKRKPPR